LTILQAEIFENDRFIFYVTNYQNHSAELHHFFEMGFERSFTQEVLSWLHLGHPRGLNRIYIAREKENGKFVSTLCFQPFEYQWQGKVCKISICTNAVTHADFRHQGLFSTLNRLSYEQEAKLGTGFNMAFPRRMESLSGFIKSGWNHPLELVYYNNAYRSGALLRLGNERKTNSTYQFCNCCPLIGGH